MIHCSVNHKELTDFFSQEIEHYDKWLMSQSPTVHKTWKSRLSDPGTERFEPALAEAVSYFELVKRVDRLELHECPSHGGVDFHATTDGNEFLCEVTNISINTTTNIIQQPHRHSRNTLTWTTGSITDRVRKKVQSKDSQVSKEDLPVILFVSTFHQVASHECFDKYDIEMLAIGKKFWSVPMVAHREFAGSSANARVDISKSIFYRADCSLVSRDLCALLVSGFTKIDRSVYGVAHPNPPKLFSPTWIPGIEFVHSHIDGDKIHAYWVS